MINIPHLSASKAGKTTECQECNAGSQNLNKALIFQYICYAFSTCHLKVF